MKALKNGKKILEGINVFGFSYLRLTMENILDKNGYIKLGHQPADGVTFEEDYKEEIN